MSKRDRDWIALGQKDKKGRLFEVNYFGRKHGMKPRQAMEFLKPLQTRAGVRRSRANETLGAKIVGGLTALVNGPLTVVNTVVDAAKEATGPAFTPKDSLRVKAGDPSRKGGVRVGKPLGDGKFDKRKKKFVYRFKSGTYGQDSLEKV